MGRALIIVDVQNDFCEGGAMAVAGGNRVAGDVAALLDSDHGYDLVAATADWHRDPGGHFAADGTEPDFVDSWPVHCKADTDGAQLHADVDAAIGRATLRGAPQHIPVFRKGEYTASFTGFDGRARTWPAATLPDDWDGGTTRTLDEWLQAHDIDAVDVVGLAYDYCVKATAIDAAERGYATRVLAGLTAAVAAPTRDGYTTADDAYVALTAAGVDVVDRDEVQA